jgi:hypothetical protein
MASSFLIFHPDVPSSALNITTLASPSNSSLYFNEDFPFVSSFYGETYNHAKFDVATLPAGTTGFTATFDLGTGNTRNVDHLVIGGVKSLLAAGVTGVYLQASTNGSFWFNLIGTTTNFQTRTRNGIYNDDVVFTPTYNDEIGGAASSYRYFRFVVSGATANTALAFRKLYFGTAFDMGAEPSTSNMEVSRHLEVPSWACHYVQGVLSEAHIYCRVGWRVGCKGQ